MVKVPHIGQTKAWCILYITDVRFSLSLNNSNIYTKDKMFYVTDMTADGLLLSLLLLLTSITAKANQC